ncbi:hypothetical protein [uncultured Ruminococcus sp.]|uniref:hypothetical protein n=1 Tax=uncultured Ruminococcus sp. TaxID=165186 RepID=UPI00345BEBC7
MLGKLPEDLSAKMLEKYTAEQRELSEQAEYWRKSSRQVEQDIQDVERFIQRLKKWSDAPCLTRELCPAKRLQQYPARGDAPCLTRELCLDLIKFIVVYARPEDRNAPRRIDIYYKFISKSLSDSRNLLLPQNSVEIQES